MKIHLPISDLLYELFPLAKGKRGDALVAVIRSSYTYGDAVPEVAIREGIVEVTVNFHKADGQAPDLQRAIGLYEIIDYGRARPILESLADRNPSNSEVHRMLGQISSDEGKYDAAIDHLITALRWNPKNHDALRLMGYIWSKHRNDIETANKYYAHLRPNVIDLNWLEKAVQASNNYRSNGFILPLSLSTAATPKSATIEIPSLPTYPILLVPKGLVLQNFYSSVERRPVEPREPKKHGYSATFTFDQEDWIRTGFSVVGMVLAPFALKWFFVKDYLLWVIGAELLLLYQIYRPFGEHSAALERVRGHDEEYASQKQAYEIALIKYRNDLAHYTSYSETKAREARITEEKLAKVRQSLMDSSSPGWPLPLEGQLIGASEGTLYAHLQRRFPGKMRRDVGVEVHYGSVKRMQTYTFRPDMVFHDDASNLTIAIEVDEPYVYATKEPIHYIWVDGENPRPGPDDEMNERVLRSGWLVVRFSEKQVFKSTKACVDFVEHIVEELCHYERLIDVEAFGSHYYFPSEARDRRWTVQEAQEMAYRNYRQSYR